MFHGQLLHPNWISSEKLCFVSNDGRHIGMLSKVTSAHSVVFDVRRLASLPATDTSFINGLVCGPNEEIAIQTTDDCIRFASLKTLEEAAKSGIDDNFDLPSPPSTRLPFACNQLYSVTFKCQQDVSRKSHFLVGFQANSHRLCLLPWSSTPGVEGECVMRSCSSLVLHSDFLLITNLEHQLITLPLSLSYAECKCSYIYRC
ncbi:unnamed protein product [Rodentolepis nana]|uniref:CNH domain-containing protein n=1 Tax=Rodentolepis nana TaxID=102285 RepID=A0A0R3TGT5_RODNA|nr:unnamed protein product [Rodentolepis nana]